MGWYRCWVTRGTGSHRIFPVTAVRQPRQPTDSTLAAAVAPLLADAAEATVLGHSLGGAIAFTLAANHPELPITEVVGTSMKVRWSAEELAGAAAIAAKPARVFADRAEAIDRALKLAGLAGLIDPDAPTAATLVAQADGGWRAAFDPAAVRIGVPDLVGPVRVLHERGVRIRLASGENDSMAPAEDLAGTLPVAPRRSPEWATACRSNDRN